MSSAKSLAVCCLTSLVRCGDKAVVKDNTTLLNSFALHVMTRITLRKLKADYLDNKMDLSPVCYVEYIDQLNAMLKIRSFRKMVKWLKQVNMCESHRDRKQSKEWYLNKLK